MSDNVYKKLQSARVELKTKPIKESGENKFAGYKYMELGDFLPFIVDICKDMGLCTVVSFAECASLTVVNSDNPEEKILFTSPMSTAELKGCHAIQNLGAVETYLRRYLYVAAFDIVEHDALDSTHGKKDEQKQQKAFHQPKSPPQAPPATGDDAKYLDRIKTALRATYGDDKAAALNKVEELTVWIDKDSGEVKRPGTRDFTKLKGKSLEILAHSLEKLAPKIQAEKPFPDLCPNCGGAHLASDPCAEPLCPECQEAKQQGACRNLSCPEGRPSNEP